MTRLTDEQLAAEAARWTGQEQAPSGWVDDPEAVPRAGETVSISVRLPRVMLDLLREFARREGVGYQVLMKRWLDARLREEARAIRRQARVVVLKDPRFLEVAATFEPPASAREREEPEEPHVKP
jgi:hypothetical protein